MSKFYTINIGREYGCGAKRIGDALAQRLGVPIYDKELITLAARESGFCAEFFERADEKERKGVLSSLIGYFRTPTSGNFYANDPLSNETLFQIQSNVIRRLAEEGSCIFIGRCADYILRDNPHCINLFFTANLEDRVARMASEKGITAEEAAELIEKTDRRRAAYYNYYSGKTWGAAESYDLCINTSHLGHEATAQMLIEYIDKRVKSEK